MVAAVLHYEWWPGTRRAGNVTTEFELEALGRLLLPSPGMSGIPARRRTTLAADGRIP